MAAARLPLALAMLLALHLAAPAGAATFPVTSTADAGAGTLRQAIDDANGSEGVDRIEFAIPAEACSAEGVCRIELASTLPPLTEGVVIDGTTQPRHGTAPENVCATPAAPSSMRIEVVGFYGGEPLEPLLSIVSPEPTEPVTIRGLALGGDGTPIQISSAGPHRIQCNHIGVTADGEEILEIGFTGVGINEDGAGAIVGTDGDGIDDPAERNVIAPYLAYGIYVNGNSDNRIAGNRFGSSASGAPLACSTGIYMRQASARNLIGSNEDGVSDDDETNHFDACNLAVWLPFPTWGQDNRIVRNRFGAVAANTVAIDLQDSVTVVRNNVVGSSTNVGVRIANEATLGAGSAGNCLEGNQTGLRHEGSAAIAFERSWWGAADGPGGAGPGSGDAIELTSSGSVDYAPFQTSGCVFVPEAPAGPAGAASALALLLVAIRRCASSSSA